MVTQISSSNAMIPATTTSVASGTANSAGSFDFSQAMAAALAASANQTNTVSIAHSAHTSNVNLLTDAASSQTSRPNIKQFMDKTGASFEDASELIYGVVGSNTDKRNWQAIMSSNDPVTMARQATAALYNSGDDYADAKNANRLTPESTIAKSGNFALEQVKDDKGEIIDRGLRLVDSQGLLLRSAGQSSEQIQRNAWLFGFDTAPLKNLVEPAKQFDPSLANNMALLSSAGSTNTATVAPVSPTTPVSPTQVDSETSASVENTSVSASGSSSADVGTVATTEGSNYISTLDMLAGRLALQNNPELMKKLTDIMAKLV